MADDALAAMERRIRWQADACLELGSALYHGLLHHVADDVLDGGPALDVLHGHETDPGPSALALRLMGGVHRLVLERRAPRLAAFYPSMGGGGSAADAWPALRQVFVDHRAELQSLLDQPPQTNEVGRASALVGALHHLAAEWPGRVRLFEIGASAGLNLRADHFRITAADGTAVGPFDSPVLLSGAWEGSMPPLGPQLSVAERGGCDIAPLDPTTEEGRLQLTSYVWPDQRERLERLRGAMALAARVPAGVRRESAGHFVGRLELAPDTTTVVWHSVMWQYLPADERESIRSRLDELGAGADPRSRLAHIALEPRRRAADSRHEFLVSLRVWPGAGERILGAAAPHGVPTSWD